jgi:hypothetical protein
MKTTTPTAHLLIAIASIVAGATAFKAFLSTSVADTAADAKPAVLQGGGFVAK